MTVQCAHGAHALRIDHVARVAVVPARSTMINPGNDSREGVIDFFLDQHYHDDQGDDEIIKIISPTSLSVSMMGNENDNIVVP